MKDCYSNSLKLLVRRDYSTYKLTQKLLSKGFEPNEIEESIDKLKSQKYINDQNYLEDLVRHYARNKKGPRYILQKCEAEKLQATEELIYQIYEELDLSVDEMIREHIRKKLVLNNVKINELGQDQRYKLYSKLSSHLLSKGYIVQNIEQYIVNESDNERERN